MRETGVDPQGGITSGHQRIEYDENARDQCLVEIVKAFGVWHRTDFIQIQLLPEGVANQDLRPLIEDEEFVCKYVVKIGNYEEPEIPVKIEPFPGGLYIRIPKPDRNGLVRIRLRYRDRRWKSDYESLNSYGIHLR